MDKVLGWGFKLINSRSKRALAKNQRVVDYIQQCSDHLKRIICSEDYSEKEIDYSHGWVKCAYYDLLKIVEDLVTAAECDILRHSLIAGRIYYHANKYGQVSDMQIQKDYEERFHRLSSHFYSQDHFRQNSYEIVLRELVKDGKVISESERIEVLNKIKEVCLEDIVRIDSMKEQFKSRQVFIVAT